MFSYGLLQSVIVKILQKDIDKFKKCQTNESTKDSFTEKKRKAWNRGKRTQMLVTVTEGLAATITVKTVDCFAGELRH